MEKKKITPFRHDYYDLEEEEVVFDPKPPKTLNKINQENIHMENKQMMGYGSFIISQKWHRLYRLNQWFDRKEQIKEECKNYFYRLINGFHINYKIKKFILKEVLNKNPRSLHDIIIYIFQCIEEHNFPITTAEFRNQVKKEFKIGKKTMPFLYSNCRDYSWFINKVLNNLDLDLENKHKIFSKVLENFNKLHPVIQKSPTGLISTLCRLSYKALGIKDIMPDYDVFLTSVATYGKYRRILKALGVQLPRTVRVWRNKN